MDISVNGYAITFRDFSGIREARLRQNLARLVTPMGRMPDKFLEMLSATTIVIANKLAGSRGFGGGYWPPEDIGQWRGRSNRTGISDQQLIEFKADVYGIVAITKSSMARRGNSSMFMVLHEMTHAIDNHFSISRRLTLDDLQGIRYGRIAPRSNGTARFVARRSVKEYFAEAYSRYLVRPNGICRAASVSRDFRRRGVSYGDIDLPNAIPDGENQRSCSSRIGNTLASHISEVRAAIQQSDSSIDDGEGAECVSCASE